MVILGLVGPTCSGKETFSKVMSDLFNFRVVKLDNQKFGENQSEYDNLEHHIDRIM